MWPLKMYTLMSLDKIVYPVTTSAVQRGRRKHVNINFLVVPNLVRMCYFLME